VLGLIENGGIAVEFFRSGDRVAHRVLLKGDLVAESVEGTPFDDWPLSPPFQEVHFEERDPDGRIALLVGMAGRSHWSASVAAEGDGIRWDIACRVREAPTWLGAAYQIAGALSIAATSATVTTPAGSRLQFTGDTAWESRDARLQLSVPLPTEKFPQTLVWQYAVRVAPQTAR
jgi:hypothetical protein